MDDVKSCCDVDHTQHEEFITQLDRWDKVGLALSSLCAIHCLLAPILVLSVPVLGQAFEQPWIHLLLAVFVVPVGLFAFYTGYGHHHKKGLTSLGVAGLALVCVGLLAPISGVNFLGHDVITIIGSFCLVIAHILNRRACLCHRH